jgi:hypothetical protein
MAVLSHAEIAHERRLKRYVAYLSISGWRPLCMDFKPKNQGQQEDNHRPHSLATIHGNTKSIVDAGRATSTLASFEFISLTPLFKLQR